MWGKGNPCALLVGMQIGVTTVDNSMEFPQKIKNEPALWLSGSIYRDLSKETQNTNSKEYTHPYVHCSIIYNSQAMEAAQVPIDRRVDKKAVVPLHNGMLLGRKKEWNLTICNSMDGPKGYYAQWNKSAEKDKYHMISLMYGI